MKTFFTRTVVLATALLLGGNAIADDNLWFGVKAGTLGIGLEASCGPLPWLGLGLGAAGMKKVTGGDVYFHAPPGKAPC